MYKIFINLKYNIIIYKCIYNGKLILYNEVFIINIFILNLQLSVISLHIFMYYNLR